MTYKKKLIEVALPLDAINEACIEEKSTPRRGHPSTLHIWWARRPLAAARAVILSSLIDDPGSYLSEKDAKKEREKLMKLIADSSKWKNRHNNQLWKKINLEINKSCTEKPILLDPFSGGGTIPLEGMRLGLTSYGIDLNPIATLLGKGLIEICQGFEINQPINPNNKGRLKGNWSTIKAIAEDIRYYGDKIFTEAKKEIGEFFPYGPNGEEIIGWFWCKSIQCSNPACRKNTDLVKNYVISTRKEGIFFQPIIVKNNIKYEVKTGIPSLKATKVSRGANFRCLHCDELLNEKYVKQQSIKKKIKWKLIGLVCKSNKGKIYYPAKDEDEQLALKASPKWTPEEEMNPHTSTLVSGRGYGINYWKELFIDRQLLALTTIVDIINKTTEQIEKDAEYIIKTNENKSLSEGGVGPKAYAEAITTYLSFSFDKLVDWYTINCNWIPRIEGVGHTFSKQAIPASWDFIEINPFSNSVGNFLNHVNWVSKVIEDLPEKPRGRVINIDSSSSLNFSNENFLISTDPPYYNNISYADLSDFFYIWMRKILKNIWPNIFSTLMVPKTEEIVAESYRFNNDKKLAEKHFQESIEKVLVNINKRVNKLFPISIYYAFKQKVEVTDLNGDLRIYSSGWDTMLTALMNSGFQIIRTWPMRTERSARSISIGTNALASSIVLVCRPRPESAPISTRREFIKSLKKEIPPALKKLQEAGIAPVDMAQSAIGPGMAVFSKYSKVLEADGNQMSVRTALQIINQELAAFLTEQVSDMDQETRFCIAWYEQFGWKEGPFGDANTLATAKGTAVNALERAEVVYAKAGKVRLLKQSELDDNWDPTTDKKLTVWECVHHLIKRLDQEGEDSAAKIIRKIGGLAESVKELTYRLYSMCEKKGWTEDGIAYNTLISSWQSISDKAQYYDKISEETKKRLKDKTQKKLNDL